MCGVGVGEGEREDEPGAGRVAESRRVSRRRPTTNRRTSSSHRTVVGVGVSRGWNGARASRTRARPRRTSRRASRRARRAGRYGRRRAVRTPTSAAWRPRGVNGRRPTTTIRRGRPRRERPPRPAIDARGRDETRGMRYSRCASRLVARRARVTRASRAPVPDRVVVACRDDS